MTGYPGYRSGEVITRLRGANKRRAASLITDSIASFSARSIGDATHDVPSREPSCPPRRLTA